jgi:hypothetical protein
MRGQANREAVGVQAQKAHQLHVLAPAMVVIAGQLAVAAVDHLSR